MQNVVFVLDTSFYVHAIRTIDDFRNIDYNGIVSVLIIVTLLTKGVWDIDYRLNLVSVKRYVSFAKIRRGDVTRGIC